MIFDLDKKNPNGLLKFDGTYADFLIDKNDKLSALQSIEEKKKNLLRRETAWLRRGAKARQTKQKARIERAHELGQEVDHIEDLRQSRVASFDFGDVVRNPKKLIDAENISVSFNGKTLFHNINYTLRGKSRLGIIGANGCGKSTLIKTLLGEITPTAGKVKITDGISAAYFEQNRNILNPKLSVLKNICPDGDYVKFQGEYVFARSYLSRFHFRPDQLDLPVEKLSGGEQSRLLLAQLMLKSESILVLDEPTNDLDVDTLDTLAEAIENYEGAIILVTHDRFFMDQVVDEILAFDGKGNIEKFSDYFQWDRWRQSLPKKAKTEQDKVGTKNEKVIAKGKLSYKEQFEFDNIEDKIHQAEALLSKLQEEIIHPEAATDFKKLSELSNSIELQKNKVQQLYSRWEELEKKRE